MDRIYELENLHRSLAMLNPGARAGLRRGGAMQLLDELSEVQGRLERLRGELRRLVEGRLKAPVQDYR